MKRNRKILLIALAVFIASFFLPGIYIRGIIGSIQGYLCAWVTLASPWANDARQELSAQPLEFIAITLSGFINPLFLISLALLQKNKTKKAGEILRIVVLCLFPACWTVFLINGYYPHVGYFLWAAAIVVALFSHSLMPRNQLQIEPAKA